MASSSQSAHTFNPLSHLDSESLSQDRIFRTLFEPQPNGYNWSIETGEQSLHCAYQPPADPSTPSPRTATSTFHSNHLNQAPASQASPVSRIFAERGSGATTQNQMAPPNATASSLHRAFAPSASKATHPAQRTPASRRSKYFTLDWEAHRETIRQLYMIEEKSLKETMKIMAQQYDFHASEKLYKDKFKEWAWCKNLSAATAQWMLGKANMRRLEEEKQTIFVIAGRVWTIDRVEKSARRSGWQPGAEVPAANAPTPAGVAYSTPRDVLDYPSPPVASPTSSRSDEPDGTARWTPAPELSHPTNRFTMRLSWNGCTKEGAMKLFSDAVESDQQGDFKCAEKKFRSALAAFAQLLSPTHEATNNVAYSLASFYARLGRMGDADLVLDWMNEKHSDYLGIGNELTVRHALRVVDLLNSWHRPQDALAFLEKARDCLWQKDNVVNGQATSLPSNSAENAASTYQLSMTGPLMFEPAPIFNSFSTNVSLNQSTAIRHQLHSAEAHIRAGDGSIETLLLSLIAQCEQDPESLVVQNLRARAELINLYWRLGNLPKAVEELPKAQISFITAWNQNDKISKELMDASLYLAIQCLKLGQYHEADELFQMVQNQTVDRLGPDNSRTICLLIQIGLVYQNENRWHDAEPRFEQALAASMTANGLDDAMTKSLEIALENRQYSFMKSEPGDFKTMVGWNGILIRPSMSLDISYMMGAGKV